MILRSSTISLLVVLALVLTASGEEWSCPSCPLCTEDEARYLCARYGYAEYCDCVEPEEPPPVNDTGEDEFIFTPDEDREINGTDAMKDMKDAVVPNLMPSGVDGTMTGKPCRFPRLEILQDLSKRAGLHI